MPEKKKCPCHSGKAYQDCCQSYHEGKTVDDVVSLMRSRYAAYALGFVDYIIQTTHPKNPEASRPLEQRKREICDFSKNTVFEGLHIQECINGEKRSFVTFSALMRQGRVDVSFIEKSLFEKVNGKWLYLSGEILSPNQS